MRVLALSASEWMGFYLSQQIKIARNGSNLYRIWYRLDPFRASDFQLRAKLPKKSAPNYRKNPCQIAEF